MPQFTDTENKTCIACNHVVNRVRPILYAACDEGNTWLFLCGNDDHAESDAITVSLQSILDIDDSVSEVTTMQSDFVAQRTTSGSKWEVLKQVEK